MIRFDTTKPYMGRLFTIVIKYASGFQLNDLNTMRMEDHPMALNFINSIVKSGLRASKLVQIGRNPRFFDPDNKQIHRDVEIWPGFFTSTWIFQSGLYLIIDNISKFLSSDNFFTVIERMRQSGASDQSISSEFEGAVVMVTYG